jgi:hypothetical protein
MSDETKTKTKTAENTSQDTTIQQTERPCFPREEGGVGTQPSRAIYSGGADEQTEQTEQTPLLQTPSPYGEIPQVQPAEEVPLRALRTQSQTTTCPNCRELVLSTVKYANGFCTWITCMFCVSIY